MNTTDAPSARLITSRGKGELFMNKRTRILSLAALLALCGAGAALWAQSGGRTNDTLIAIPKGKRD
jgi:hypothetical protein